MQSVPVHSPIPPSGHRSPLARMIDAWHRSVLAALAALCIAPCTWAIPTTSLAPGGPQGTIILSRLATYGGFTVDYDFTLTTAASAIYNTGRFNLADSPIGPIRIDQFSAQLFLLIGNIVSGAALASGVDTDHLGFLSSSDFFAASLNPGDYRLRLSGFDQNSGYGGVFRVTPPVPAQFSAQVPEPQSWALLLIALGSLLLAQRPAQVHRPRLHVAAGN